METKVKCVYDKMVNIDELIDNPQNPNRHPIKQIKVLGHILLKQGWRVPIVVSKLTGYIVRGHCRKAAAKYIGLTECPVNFQDYTSKEEEYLDMIADNKVSEMAELDEQLVTKILQNIDHKQFDLELSGYLRNEIENMFLLSTEENEKYIAEGIELMPFEKHDYIVFLFDNEYEFENACEKMGIKKVVIKYSPKLTKVGLGRLRPGVELLKLLAQK